MKSFKLYKWILFLFLPFIGSAQPYNLFKPDSINLCVLKLDFTSYTFEGGSLSYYKKCVEGDTLPFDIDFQSPGDFGEIKFKIRTTNEIIFNASIVWAGTGKIHYPVNYNLEPPFNIGNNKVLKPDKLEYFGFGGIKVTDDTVFIQHADSAWNAISNLTITNLFAQYHYKAGIYLYPPSVGMFNSSKAKWIVFLYQSDPITEIILFPNPIEDIIHVRTLESFDIEIFDATGNLVKSGALINNLIDFKEFSAGVYLIRLKNENQTVNKRIIKIKTR